MYSFDYLRIFVTFLIFDPFLLFLGSGYEWFILLWADYSFSAPSQSKYSYVLLHLVYFVCCSPDPFCFWLLTFGKGLKYFYF